MENFRRRSFLKLMGQFTAVLCMGLSHKKALALGGNTANRKRTKRIAVEEHVRYDEFSNYIFSLSDSPPESPPAPGMPGGGGQMMKTLSDGTQVPLEVIGNIDQVDMRLKEMDAVGIDMHVLSISNPGVTELDASEAIKWSKKINDKLAEVVNKYPTRFAAFSTIPWQDPTAAVAELERAVKELGLKGIKLDGTVNGEYLDSKRFWPIHKKAEELGTPIFIHVENARPSFIEFYSEFSQSRATSGAGRDLDVCMHAFRLIASGLFEECPDLKFILGHMGAGVPFWTKRFGGEKYIKNNIFVATSGNFYQPALMCCYQAAGVDQILFAVDFPSDSNKQAIQLIESAPISNNDKEKIYHLNAERIFSL